MLPEFPVSSPLGYIGVFLLVLGVFLVLTGINIIKIQQVSVTPGKQTWGLGIILTIIGLVSILTETSGLIAKKSPATITPTSTISTSFENTNLSPDEILNDAKTWPIVLSSSFETDDGKWALGEFRDGGETGQWSILNGKYVWEMKTISDDAFRVNYPAISAISNFYVSVDANLVKGTLTNARYGLVFRGTANEAFYTFRIEDGSYYGVRINPRDSSWISLTDKTSSSAIYLNRSNRLAVIANGAHFRFYINDQYITEVFDSRLSTGNVGLITRMEYEGEEAVFEFDNFELRGKP